MTRRGDEQAWGEFVSWCEARGLTPLPANPWTLAAYARSCEHRQRYPAIAKAVRAIARVHNTKSRRRPERHPIVARTLRLLETRAKKQKRTKNKGAELFPEQDLADDQDPAAGKRTKPKPKRQGKGKGKRKGLSSGPKLVPRRRLKG